MHLNLQIFLDNILYVDVPMYIFHSVIFVLNRTSTSILEYVHCTLFRYRIVGDVRGKGLMIGIEMVEDKETKKPLRPEAMMNIWDRTKNAGVLIGKYGYI